MLCKHSKENQTLKDIQQTSSVFETNFGVAVFKTFEEYLDMSFTLGGGAFDPF